MFSKFMFVLFLRLFGKMLIFKYQFVFTGRVVFSVAILSTIRSGVLHMPEKPVRTVSFLLFQTNFREADFFLLPLFISHASRNIL